MTALRSDKPPAALAALAALVLALALAACATSHRRVADAPANPCRAAVMTAVGQIAHHIYDEAQAGSNAAGYAYLVRTSARLARAVAARDAAATQAAVAQLLRMQIIHIRITASDGSVLADMGKPGGLAPIDGALSDARGATIGSYTISVQDASAYATVLHRLSGAEVLLRSGARQLRGTLDPGPRTIPTSGTVAYRGRSYEALSFDGAAFPAAPLRISVLVPVTATDGATCAGTPSQTIAETLGAAGRRLYEEEASSGDVTATLDRIEHSARFVHDVQRADRAGTLRSIVGFFRLHRLHVVRVRVLRAGKLFVDLGGRFVLGPARGVLRDRRGQLVGSFVAAVQDDVGYFKLARRFLGADVVMRAGRRVVISTVGRVRAALPAHGIVRIGGRRYRVYSFLGQAFPSGPLRITLLFAIS